MSREALGEQLLLPVLEGKLIRVGRDPVPQRLHIVDLILDGQIIETWRRQGQRHGHTSKDYHGERHSIRRPVYSTANAI